MEFSHMNKKGEAIMVDIGDKLDTDRTAIAEGSVKMQAETLKSLLACEIKKGDGLSSARIAGIMAAKRTWELIPLCHNIPIEAVEIAFSNNGSDTLFIRALAKTSYKTGIEMECLTAVSVAALTIYDMCKAIDKKMVISDIHLVEKHGGKSDFYYD